MPIQTLFTIKTPVIFLIFNRPDTTKRVFEAIRQAKPKKLLVVADGPRTDKPGEVEKCAAVRSIIDTLDWDCELLTNYSDVNLGCKKRVSSGLDWVFEQVEEAIILEDDCLPHPTFFKFCEEMLKKYRDDKKIMAVCGNNPLGKWKAKIQSYHFSYYFNCWGWATWKRTWQLYDVEMKLWLNELIQKEIENYISNKLEFLYYKREFDRQFFQKQNSWAYPFSFLCLMKQGWVINPSVNLISNIGFGNNATNLKVSSKHILSNRNTYQAIYPFKEPQLFDIDREFTSKQYQLVWDRSLINKIRRKLLMNSGI